MCSRLKRSIQVTIPIHTKKCQSFLEIELSCEIIAPVNFSSKAEQKSKAIFFVQDVCKKQ